MNYALLKQWAETQEDFLAGLGVDRADARRMLDTLQADAINCESRDRKDNQFLLDLKSAGTKGLAERYGVSAQTIRNKRARILAKKNATGACAPACAA